MKTKNLHTEQIGNLKGASNGTPLSLSHSPFHRKFDLQMIDDVIYLKTNSNFLQIQCAWHYFDLKWKIPNLVNVNSLRLLLQRWQSSGFFVRRRIWYVRGLLLLLASAAVGGIHCPYNNVEWQNNSRSSQKQQQDQWERVVLSSTDYYGKSVP